MARNKDIVPSPPGLTPRLVRREGAAFYLGVSLSAFDTLAEQNADQLRPVPVPAVRTAGGKKVLRVPNGETMRVRLYDVRDLDRYIDSLKARS